MCRYLLTEIKSVFNHKLIMLSSYTSTFRVFPVLYSYSSSWAFYSLSQTSFPRLFTLMQTETRYTYFNCMSIFHQTTSFSQVPSMDDCTCNACAFPALIHCFLAFRFWTYTVGTLAISSQSWVTSNLCFHGCILHSKAGCFTTVIDVNFY